MKEDIKIYSKKVSFSTRELRTEYTNGMAKALDELVCKIKATEREKNIDILLKDNNEVG